AALGAADLVAAEAAVLADEVVAAQDLGRLLPAAVADQVGHQVVALDAARLDEASRQHRERPVVERLPAVPLLPLAPLDRGVCAARVNSVALRWPWWQVVQPNFSIGCGLLESTNRSSRGWALYILTCASVNFSDGMSLPRSPGSKPMASSFFLRFERNSTAA